MFSLQICGFKRNHSIPSCNERREIKQCIYSLHPAGVAKVLSKRFFFLESQISCKSTTAKAWKGFKCILLKSFFLFQEKKLWNKNSCFCCFQFAASFLKLRRKIFKAFSVFGLLSIFHFEKENFENFLDFVVFGLQLICVF